VPLTNTATLNPKTGEKHIRPFDGGGLCLEITPSHIMSRRTLSLKGVFELLLAAAVASGCGSVGERDKNSASDSAPVAVTSYLCHSGATARVAWWREKIEVSFRGEQWTLPRVLAASGTRYSAGEIEVWEHQGKLRITVGRSAPQLCLKN
jgi:membrane-bound inhibitor of C-type lysozyme